MTNVTPHFALIGADAHHVYGPYELSLEFTGGR